MFSKSRIGRTLAITASSKPRAGSRMFAQYVRRPDGTIELMASRRTATMLAWLGVSILLVSIGKPIVRELRWRAMMRRDLETLGQTYSHMTKSQFKGESEEDWRRYCERKIHAKECATD